MSFGTKKSIFFFELWAAEEKSKRAMGVDTACEPTWPLTKVQEVAYTLFLPQGVEFDIIFALWA